MEIFLNLLATMENKKKTLMKLYKTDVVYKIELQSDHFFGRYRVVRLQRFTPTTAKRQKPT